MNRTLFPNCYGIQILRIANDSKASHEERANTMEKQMEIMRKQVNHNNKMIIFNCIFSSKPANNWSIPNNATPKIFAFPMKMK